VDEHLDHGAIILQKAVEVKYDDTAETLSKRIIKYEHASYVEAIRQIVCSEIEIVGRRVLKKNI
jgi:phosphoribosylglycinamide formyltransferase-1